MNLLYKYKKKKLFYYISFLKIYKSLVFDLTTKFNIYNYFNLPKLLKITLTITLSNDLKNETDIKIINALSILDFLVMNKSGIYNLTNKYVKKKKKIIFISKLTLNNWNNFYLVLINLNKIIIPTLKRKFIFLNFKINKSHFFFKINDISSLDELPDNLKKDKVGITFSFILKKNNNIFINNYFLNLLGLCL